MAAPTDESTPRPGSRPVDAGLAQHLERLFPGPGRVSADPEPRKIRVDLHVRAATPQRPFHLLVTAGMSEMPMEAPREAQACRLAEVCMALPAEWPLDEESHGDPIAAWPFTMLRMLARYPHICHAWLWHGQAADLVPRGAPDDAPLRALAFEGVILRAPWILLPQQMGAFAPPDGTVVRIFCAVPLYRDELEFRSGHEDEMLFEKLSAGGVSELLNPDRASVISAKVPKRRAPESGRRSWLGRFLRPGE